MSASEDVADALLAVKEEGVARQYERQNVTLDDPDKPWLGGTASPTETAVNVAFLDRTVGMAFIKRWKGEDAIPQTARYALMGNHGFTPELGGRILGGARPLVVSGVTAIAPQDVPVLFLLEMTE